MPDGEDQGHRCQGGDCLQLGGIPDKPQAARATCGSPESNFKVVSAVGDRLQCPTDVDSSYSTHNAFSGASNAVCLDIDWVLGGCMSIDPSRRIEQFRVECGDTSPARHPDPEGF